MQDIEVAIVDGKYDLRQYQCPMNLVVAKHIVYTKNSQSLTFLLASEQALINIQSFLQFKGYKTTKTECLMQGKMCHSLYASL